MKALVMFFAAVTAVLLASSVLVLETADGWFFGKQPTPKDFETLREAMVKDQIVARGVRQEAVLNAMRNTPRHLFVPEDRMSSAYEDRPLPIGNGQTISQPYIVA